MHYYSRGPLRYVKNPQKPLFHSSLLLMEKTARIQCIYSPTLSLSGQENEREFNVFTSHSLSGQAVTAAKNGIGVFADS